MSSRAATTPTAAGDTRLVMKLTDDAKTVAQFKNVGFLITVNGVENTVLLDCVYAGLYNGDTTVTAEDLGATYSVFDENL